MRYVLIILGTLLVILVSYLAKVRSDHLSACGNRDGIPVQGRNGEVCIHKNVTITLEEE